MHPVVAMMDKAKDAMKGLPSADHANDGGHVLGAGGASGDMRAAGGAGY